VRSWFVLHCSVGPHRHQPAAAQVPSNLFPSISIIELLSKLYICSFCFLLRTNLLILFIISLRITPNAISCKSILSVFICYMLIHCSLWYFYFRLRVRPRIKKLKFFDLDGLTHSCEGLLTLLVSDWLSIVSRILLDRCKAMIIAISTACAEKCGGESLRRGML